MHISISVHVLIEENDDPYKSQLRINANKYIFHSVVGSSLDVI